MQVELAEWIVHGYSGRLGMCMGWPLHCEYKILIVLFAHVNLAELLLLPKFAGRGF